MGGANSLNVSANNIERLFGGSGNDSFAFGDGVTLAGGGLGTYINGGGGTNALDYSAYTTNVTVNLFNHSATGINNGLSGGIDNIQNVIGGSLFNDIWGDNNDNVLVSGTTNDNLHGLAGNDTYVFYNSWGTDFVFDTSGNDTLTFINVTTGLTLTFQVGSALISNGLGDTVTTDGNVENFIGTNQNDTFVFQPGATVAGNLDGQGGQDVLDFSSTATVRSVLLTDVGTLNGFKGTVNGIGGQFDNVNEIKGSSAPTNSLTGRNATAAFNLGASDQYVSLNTLDFSGFENLSGGTGADTFNVTTNHSQTLSGGLGGDHFVFTAGATLTSSVNGNAGYDTLDFSGYGAARTVNLTGIGATDGFNGTNSAISAGFSNIDNLVGFSGAGDVLNGASLAATFSFDGTGRHYSFVSNSLDFTGFETLNGGNLADTFKFDGSGGYAGTLNGAGGTDRFDFSGYGSPVTLNLQAASVTGLTGTFSSIEDLTGSGNADTLIGPDAGANFNLTSANAGNLNGTFSFTSVENLQGGSGTDILNYSAYVGPVSVYLQTSTATGLSGNFSGFEGMLGSASTADMLVGLDAGNTFTVSGPNSGNANGSFTFSAVENLSGSTGVDVFSFTGSGTLSGNVSGGANTDTLDYSGYGSAVTFNLQTNSATGLGGFNGIEAFIGSAANDTLSGPNAGTIFYVTDTNQLTVNGLVFNSVENLTGGTGIDTIDYSLYPYATGVTVNLLTHVTDGLSGAVNAIENINGSPDNDTLIGDNNANVINGLAGNDQMTGNSGNDTFLFMDGWGSDTVVELALGGTDTMTFASVTVPLTFTLNTTDIFVSDGATNQVTHLGNFVENLIGGPQGDSFVVQASASTNLYGGDGTDSFAFQGGAVLTGLLDGQVGNDSLDFSGYATPASITLTGTGANGFTGTTLSVTAGFANIASITGSSLGSDSLTGMNAAATFNLDSTTTYVTGGHTLTFSAFESLHGGSSTDIFAFADGAAFTGTLNGGSGSGTLDLSAYTSGREVTLTALGTVGGFRGTLDVLTGSFDNLDLLVGSGAGGDRLTGMDATATWNIAATYTYVSGGRTLVFSQVEILRGGSGADTFTFANAASIASLLDGSGGTDTLNFAAYSTPRNLVLTAVGSLDGFQGTEASLPGGFDNIDGFVGGSSGSDLLTGLNVISNWTVNGSNQYTSSGHAISFSNTEILIGGTATDIFTVTGNQPFTLRGGDGADTFIFNNGASLTGGIQGGAGFDTVNASAYSTARNVTLSGYTADGYSGSMSGLGTEFSGVDRLYGSSAANDTLTGPNGGAVITVSGANSGDVDGVLSFYNYENLVGGTGNDTFAFTGSGTLSGTLNAGAGTDLLDYGSYSSGVHVNLNSAVVNVDAVNYSARSATGIFGGAANGLSNFENIVGSTSADVLIGDNSPNAITGGSGADKLVGLGGNDLYLFADNYGVDSIRESAAGGSDTLDFSALTQPLAFTLGIGTLSAGYTGNLATHTGDQVESIIGGSVDDVFTFIDAATFPGTLDGSNGADTLDYAAYSTSVTVDLSAGTATGVTSVSNIENIIGGSVDDSLTGDANANVINGGPGNDLLYGLGGDDTYTFNDGFGLDTVYEVSGAGNDTLDFSAVSQPLTFTFSPTTVTVSYSFDALNHSVTHTGIYVENFIGGGTGTSSSTLDLSSSLSGHIVLLTDIGTTRGFKGTVLSIPVNFDDIDVILGSTTALDDQITGMNAAATWTVNGASNQYAANTRTLNLQDFETLRGGTADDAFNFADGASFAGAIDGGDGNNTLSFAGNTNSRIVTLTGIDATDGFAGQIDSASSTFTNIDVLTGGNGSDTLTGADLAATWEIDGSDRYLYSTHALAFTGFELLQGGTLADSFDFSGSAVFAGSIDGQAGSDVLDFSAYAAARHIILSGAGATDGMSGSEAAITGTFTNIDNLIGHTGNGDILTGANQPATFSFGVDLRYTLGSKFALFSGFETLQGGSANDTFAFSGSGSFTGLLQGGGGADQFDYAAYSSQVTLTLTGGNASGYSGTASGLIGTFEQMDSALGSAFNDTLAFTNLVGLVFHLTGLDMGTLDSFGFQSFEHLLGSLTGGTIDFGALSIPVAITLNGLGTDIGFAGTATDLTAGFDNLTSIIGGTSVLDSLTGRNATANWDITGDHQVTYTSVNTLSILNFELLIGGTQDDVFAVSQAINFNGSLDGSAGSDTLTYASNSASVNVTLNAVGLTDGFDGTGTGLNGGFANIDQLIGGTGNDTLTGANLDATFNLPTTPAGYPTYEFGGHTLTIQAFEDLTGGSGNDTFNLFAITPAAAYNLNGGAGDDTFVFADGAALTGSIDGGSGLADTLDYSAYTTTVLINLSTGLSTNVSAGVSGIENLIGGSAADTLIGDGGVNFITGNGEDDILQGGAGNDTYLFGNGWGADTVTDTSGTDTLDFGAVTNTYNLTVDLALLHVSDASTNSVDFTGIDIIHGGQGDDLFKIDGSQTYDLYGGLGVDLFQFTNAGKLIGKIDGEAGSDTLDYHLDLTTYTDPRYFLLTGLGSLDGFNGNEVTISAGFFNIDVINSGLGVDTVQGLDANAEFDIHTTHIEYKSGGHTLDTFGLENLVGGNQSDLFVFDDGAVLPGIYNSIDGKAGIDTLDYSAYTTPISVDLIGGVATGVQNGVASIEQVIGSSFAGNTLYGDSGDNTFYISGPGDYYIYGRGGNDTYIFDADNPLGNDVIYEDPANSGSGLDTLSFAPTTLPVTADLSVTGSGQTVNLNLNLTIFGTVENLIGGDGNDILTGNSSANRITGGFGNDTLNGGGGSDTYLFADGWGTDTVTDPSGGNDTFDFSAVTAPLTFTLNTAGIGVADTLLNSVSSTGNAIENLIAGSANDQFIFQNGFVLGGMINGSAGTDVLDFSAYSLARAVTLTSLGSIDGYSGGDPAVPGGFDNINDLVGSSATADLLTGLALNSHWCLDRNSTNCSANAGVSTYSADGSGRTLTFVSFEHLNGVAGHDWFTVSPGSQLATILAGAGNDTLEMLDSATLTGSFDGQGDYDTVDYSAYTTPRNFFLSPALGATDGFNGTEAVISGGFANIQQIIGSLSANSLASADSLHGRNAIATFDLGTPVEHYNDFASGRVLDLQNLEDMYGGSQVDTFNLTGHHTGRLYGQGADDIFNVSGIGDLTGFIDGGTGYDTLDYTAYASARAFDLTAVDADGFDGTEASLVNPTLDNNGFYNIDYIRGKTAAGLDSLQGLSTDGVWTLNNASAKSQYTTQGYTLDFSYIDLLIGEGGQDEFVFNDGVSLAGSIDAGAGYDTVNYANYTSPRSVTLTGLSGTDGFSGDESGTLGLGFTHINQVIGSSTSTADNLSTLDSDSTFTINSVNGGNYATGGNTLDFSDFDNLFAGTGSDTFYFVGSGTIATSLDAGDGPGTDLLDYSGYSTNVIVDFSTGAASGVNGGATGSISAFENLTGSPLADSLTGDNNPNVITGLGGNDQLYGLGGSDTYVFGDGWGQDNLTDSGGAGDTLDFSGVTVPGSGSLTFTFNGTAVTVTDSGSNQLVTTDVIENYIGGPTPDTFALQNGAVVGGFIHAGTGTDALNFNGYGSPRSVTLSALGTNDGFAGTQASILGGFDDIDAITGTSGSDTLTGLTTASTYAVNAMQAGTYTNTAHTLAFFAIENLVAGNGYDTLDFSGFGSGRAVVLTAADATGFSGNDLSINFTGMDNLVGSSATDSLTGMNASATWELDGSDRYLTGIYSLDFSSFEDLEGGTGNDTFEIHTAHTGSVSGGIDLGSGYDVLDYSFYNASIDVVTTSVGLHGFNGTETGSLTNGFINIDEILANLTYRGTNSLTGLPVAYTWNISPSLTQYAVLSQTLDFYHIGNIHGSSAVDTFVISGANQYSLYGGANDDLFIFRNLATLTGILDGEAGNDTVSYYDYSAATGYTTPVQVNLNNVVVTYNLITYQPLSATAVNAGLANSITNIESATGGQVNDILIGSDTANVLDGGPGNDTLLGGLGNDTYVFADGWGVDTVIENAAGGNDTIAFTPVTTATTQATLAVTFRRGVIGGCSSGTCASQGANLVTHSGGQIENFVGGAGNDSFIFANGATVAGSVDGQAGTDTLNFSAYSSARTIVLTGLGVVDGFNGTATGIGNGFSNMDSVIGGSASDTLTGTNSAGNFTINGSTNQYASAARAFGFSSIENLNGGSNADSFNFVGTATISGYIHGGLGTDTLDYSAYSTTISVDLLGGTATGVGGGINSIENLIGSPFGNVIYGDNNDNVFTIDSFGNTIIVGRGGNDTYIFDADSSLGQVTIDESIANGGGGIDTISFVPTTTIGVDLNLSTTGIFQTVNTNLDLKILGLVENVIGGSGNDTLTGDGNTNVLTGGPGDDALNGGGGNDTYLFAGSIWGHDTLTDSAGTLDVLDFTQATVNLNFAVTGSNMTVTGGGNQVDVTSASIEKLTGSLNIDTLDLSGYGSARGVTLIGVGSLDGYMGSVDTANPLSFDNINSLIGSTANDTLVGPNTSTTFHVDGTNAGDINAILDFNSFENLMGGTADDTFAFINSGSLSGNVNGGAGANILDYSGYTAGPVTLNLQTSQATTVGGQYSNIQTLVGSGNAADTLIGQNSGNVFHITGSDSGDVDGIFHFSSIANLMAGTGADTFAFVNAGSLSGQLDGGNGTDLLDYSSYGSGVNVDLATGTATAVYSEAASGVAGIENLSGSASHDVLAGDGGNNVINGNAGQDDLNGGNGNDTYVFGANWGAGDTITDPGERIP